MSKYQVYFIKLVRTEGIIDQMELLSGNVSLVRLALLEHPFIRFLERGTTGQDIGSDPYGTT